MGETDDEANETLHKNEKRTIEERDPHGHVLGYTRSSTQTNRRLIDKAAKRENELDHKKGDDKFTRKDKAYHRKLIREHVKGIDEAIKHSKLEHHLHVYHGTGKDFDPEHEASKHPERKIKLPGYTSTSLSRHIADDFAHPHHPTDDNPLYVGAKPVQHVIHIHLKKGQKAFHIGKHSEFAHEKEVLLPRNTTLKVHKHVDKIKNKYGSELHIHHATVVK